MLTAENNRKRPAVRPGACCIANSPVAARMARRNRSSTPCNSGLHVSTPPDVPIFPRSPLGIVVAQVEVSTAVDTGADKSSSTSSVHPVNDHHHHQCTSILALLRPRAWSRTSKHKEKWQLNNWIKHKDKILCGFIDQNRIDRGGWRTPSGREPGNWPSKSNRSDILEQSRQSINLVNKLLEVGDEMKAVGTEKRRK